MVVPETAKSPETVKLSAIVVSEVLCPIVIAVPETPCHKCTVSLPFDVHISK